MKRPDIKVQLVHLDGPYKGEINEYLSPVITLGRHPECDVVFAEDQRNISRHHAELRREGNRFLLRDTSSNGTFVNGKQQAEVFLKSGDVLILGIGGPKISFLSTVLESGSGYAGQEMPFSPSPVPARPVDTPAAPAPVEAVPAAEPERNNLFATPVRPPEPATVQKSLIIQHGASLKVFKSLPIILGRGADCDFIVPGSSILEHHAQILFEQGQYWVKDLSGRDLLSLNGQPVRTRAPLLPETFLALGPSGPTFQFLGDGRMVEVEALPAARPTPQSSPRPRLHPAQPARPAPSGKMVYLWLGGVLVVGLGVALAIYLADTEEILRHALRLLGRE